MHIQFLLWSCVNTHIHHYNYCCKYIPAVAVCGLVDNVAITESPASTVPPVISAHTVTVLSGSSTLYAVNWRSMFIIAAVKNV